MSITTLIDKITSLLLDLAKELESKGSNQLAISIYFTLVPRIRVLGKIAIFTYSIVLFIKSLNEKIRNIIKELTEKNTERVKEYIESLLNLLDTGISNIICSYSRTKILLIMLIISYISFSMIIMSNYVPVHISTIYVWTLLCIGIILFMFISLDLSMAILFIPIIPITTAIFSLYIGLENLILKLLLLLLNIVILIISIGFIMYNINYYNVLKVYLNDLEKNIVQFAKAIKGLSKIELKPTHLDIDKLMVEIYGDKAYELIKYVNDIRKLITK